MSDVGKIIRRNDARTRPGAVLILVLVIFSAMSLLAFGLCHRVRLDLKRARMRGDDLKAYYLALGGVRRALVAIGQEKQGEKQAEVDHFGQPWHLNTTADSEGFFEQPSASWLNAARLFYTVTDEEGRLNLNTTSPVGWVKLPGMTEPMIYSILDWQDEDNDAQANGAESVYYTRQLYPYKAKNRPTTMIWELALVKEIDWPLFRGEDVNGNTLLDERGENDGPAMRPMDNVDGVLDLGLFDLFTVYGEGKVNLNTAGAAVLSALPGIELQTAQAIVDRRIGADGEPFTADDTFFSSFEELLNVPGVTPYQLELLQQYAGFTSTHFRIVSEACVRPDGKTCRLMGTARRDGGDVQLVLLRRDL